MKNFIFISPNFPSNYYMWCNELKHDGLNVLGIGDQPYDELSQELKNCLTEYYKVSSLENNEEVFRAVAFLTFKHGKIDFLESNNEYWLMNDAKLRTEFNITTGFKYEEMDAVKYKSKMKKYYEAVNIPTARYILVDNIEQCQEFIQKVGYPVIAKPDNGVGANDTWKLKNDEDLKTFFEKKIYDEIYIMEEFVNGTVCSYDAIINSKGEPIFETGNVTPTSLVDVVNQNLCSVFYIQKDLPEDTRAAGRAAVKSFGVKSRFVHFEFFRLFQDQEGLGKKGDIVALEVNMRPSGGVSPDMFNYANSTNVYKIWADMIAFDKSTMPTDNPHYYCGFASRRFSMKFKMSEEEIAEKYKSSLKVAKSVEKALSGAMGDYMFIGAFADKEHLDEFYKDVLELAD